jgi:hypothetical protein
MASYISCSWCHGTNPTWAPTCAYCGHENGPRMECRCPACDDSEPEPCVGCDRESVTYVSHHGPMCERCADDLERC